MSDPPIPAGLREPLGACGPVDLLVGIPSRNNAGTAAHVVRTAQAGLARFFPEVRAVIVTIDGGSTDGTLEAVRAAALEPCQPVPPAHPDDPPHRVVTPRPGVPGQGSAFGTVLAIAAELDAKAVAVVNADLRSIQPAWMDLLLSPVLQEGFDLVAPRFLRHPYDGAINNSIVYPLTRSLYGRRIRQPIGREFGFSGRLARYCLEQGVWASELARLGADAWMAPAAVTGGFKVCQAFLGPRIHDAKEPALTLPSILQQVVGAVFDFMENHPDGWREVRGSTSVPQFGQERAEALEPVRVDAARLARAFRRGMRDLQGIWELVLRPGATRELGRIGVWDPSRFYFPTDLWVQVLHDFTLAYHRRTMDRQHLLQSLTPLYLGWVASFVGETRHAAAPAAEELEERICLRFEELKPELSGLWDAGGGPREGAPGDPPSPGRTETRRTP